MSILFSLTRLYNKVNFVLEYLLLLGSKKVLENLVW